MSGMKDPKQLTLGGLIKKLKSLSPEAVIEGLVEPDSYRGYYQDLAFERGPETTVSEVLRVCEGCKGKTFIGYKGGEFRMTGSTKVWMASYGKCGPEVIDLLEGKFVTRSENGDIRHGL